MVPLIFHAPEKMSFVMPGFISRATAFYVSIIAAY
jgi:hypothetical protein